MSSSRSRKGALTLMSFLWLFVSGFTLILIFFGIKLNTIHETLAYGDNLQQFEYESSQRHLAVLASTSISSSSSSSQTTATPSNTATVPTSTPSPTATTHTASNFTSNPCQWYPPYDRLDTYADFDLLFENLDFDLPDTITYITSLSRKYCTTFEHGMIYDFPSQQTQETFNASSEKLKIAIASIIMLPTNKSSQTGKNKLDIFKDARTYIFRLANALKYAEYHGYTLLILTDRMFEYKYTGKGSYNRKRYEEWMQGATFQKPFFLKQYLSDFDWMLWIDYDTIFLNCMNRVEDIIDYATHKHADKKQISMIFGGERFATINAGVWIIKNSEWSHRFLADWMFIEENADKFRILKADDVHRDQPLFVALLQGFDVHKKITRRTYKELKHYNDLAQKKYLTKTLNLKFEDMLEQPIWDETNAQYAVPIDEAIINAKHTHFDKGVANELDIEMRYMFVMHFYWKLKYRTDTVFDAFQYALEYCPMN